MIIKVKDVIAKLQLLDPNKRVGWEFLRELNKLFNKN